MFTRLLPSLFIGVPSIDKEHHELVSQLDALVSDPDAMLDTEGFSVILCQLGVQINTDFNNEERIFKSFGMPANEMASHVRAHTDILDQYTRLNLDLIQGKAFSRSDVLLMIKGDAEHPERNAALMVACAPKNFSYHRSRSVAMI